jgi:hypothetical protein
MFVSIYTTFFKKKLFLKGVVRGKIELDEVQEPQIEI